MLRHSRSYRIKASHRRISGILFFYFSFLRSVVEQLLAMPSLAQLLSVALFAVAVAAGSNSTTNGNPVFQAGSYTSDDSIYVDAPFTNDAHITRTLKAVNQKRGVADGALPEHAVADTIVTALDGKLSNIVITVGRSAWSRRDSKDKLSRSNHKRLTGHGRVMKRTNSGYQEVFSGTGTGLKDRDASIEGTAYLTYSLVSNSTYNVDACLAFCDRTPGCVFANLYYEFNNELLDYVFSEKSNLKCALYADIHTEKEKTNKGGQQSIKPPAGLTYIQHSSGWAAKTLADPAAPDGYELVFGPTDGANNAPGYMGFAFIDKYDVNACANLCNNRDHDPHGGACQYFNIWRALVKGVPTTYTCSMYYIPADSSTAINYGQGDLKVTYSRGYRKKTSCSGF
ncbi:hypothetical protein Hypma_006474 [Hypsizygus marmoreus]|uniref:Apple domain-containing protein n=1 Tax=Hypsizygus marmoreus TaxID=39966 RepID=A0A369K0X4_HYPMA|nr:hypothetical protein Hypma_006474 [Hypsizygus marmoreus]